MANRKALYSRTLGFPLATSSNQIDFNLSDGPNFTHVMSESTEIQLPGDIDEYLDQDFIIGVLSDSVSRLTFATGWVPTSPISDIWAVPFGSSIIRCHVGNVGGAKVFYTIEHPQTGGGTLAIGSLTGTYNNWNPTGWYTYHNRFLMTLTGSMVLTGIDPTNFGQSELTLVNTSAQSLRIRNQNTGSSAANRIQTPNGFESLWLNQHDSVRLTYDGTNSYWRIVSHTRQKPNEDFSQVLTSSSNQVAIDVEDGPTFDLLDLGEDTEIQVPSNEYEGAEVNIVATQDTTGGRRITFASGWVNAGDLAYPGLDRNSRSFITARCINDGGLKWHYVIEHDSENVDGFVATTDATVTSVYEFAPISNTTWHLDVVVLGKEDSTSNTNSARFQRLVTIVRSNTGVTTIKQNDTVGTDVNDNSYALTVDISSGAVRFRVTGVAATNMTWRIRGKKYALY